MTVGQHVYGEPFERDGVTVVPGAAVFELRRDGSQPAKEPAAPWVYAGRPVGAWVIRDGGTAQWEPAFDLTRVVVRGQLVALAIVLTIRWLLSNRAR